MFWKYVVEGVVIVAAFLIHWIGENKNFRDNHPAVSFCVRWLSVAILTFYISAVRNGKL